MGAAVTASAFLARKREGESVRSARRPERKERVESERPIMVRNWKCQP
jgi:hypothetical protein